MYWQGISVLWWMKLVTVLFFKYTRIYSLWGSHGKHTGVVCPPSSSGSHFVRTLHYDLSVLGGLNTAWLKASLSYTSPLAATRQWSVKTMACCTPWCCKELDTPAWLNNNIYIKTLKTGRIFAVMLVTLCHRITTSLSFLHICI